MAKTNTVKKEQAPVTQVSGKTVQVTGTKGGAISAAQTQAKAARLAGAAAPAQAGKYAGNMAIRIMPQEDGEGGNPHRAGTYRHKAFEAMAKCKTAGDYAKSGYKVKYLERWVKLGLVRVG